MKPHERESFLVRCRDWYRTAVKQIALRIDISDPVLRALIDVDHQIILNGKASPDSAGVLFLRLPCLQLPECSVQNIDRQWRSLLVDPDIKSGSNWESKSPYELWGHMKRTSAYQQVAAFMLQVTALPQSTAAAERCFSKLNNNKTKLRNALSV